MERNYFTPFLPDVPVTRLPDMVKARRGVIEASELIVDTHRDVLRAIEFALLIALVVILPLLCAAQVHA